jgi:Flp pilus assembly protein CpaB
VSRRTRAAAFTATAAVCAGLAAAATSGGEDEQALGSLRDVVVAARALPARQPLSRKRIAASLEVRRIPVAFAAPDALANPAEALGRRPAATIPRGSYLVGSQLVTANREDNPPTRPAPALADGVRPVEITVSAAGPLAGQVHGRVDVVVTAEPTTGGAAGGRTYVAARAVKLLDLTAAAEPSSAPDDPLASDVSIATLGLSHAQALRLIHAESFAREVRLIAS